MSDLVEDLVGQLGAERDDEFGGLALVSLVVDDVQSGQRLDVVERHLLEQCRQQHALFRSRMNGFHDPPVTLRLPDLLQQYIKTLSGKVVAQSIVFRVVSIYWQEVAPFP